MKNPLVYLNGRFVRLKDARVSILDRGFNYGDGLFETLRAYAGHVFCLNWHLERLFQSAELIFLKIPLTPQKLGSVIQETLQKNRCLDAYIRLTITRGNRLPGLLMDPSASPTIVVYVRPMSPIPEKYYRRGVSTISFPSTATKTSGIPTQVKSCDFLSRIMVREMARREGAYEGILLEGNATVTEGSSSNIFVLKKGILKTPIISPYILSGVTRRVVLDIARREKIQCSERVLKQLDLYEADEIFITNSLIEVLPVSKIDGKKVGKGNPGKITRLIHKFYLKMIDQKQN